MNDYSGYTLHKIGPYIGKLRPSLARELVIQYSKIGDWVWDPFCGSGTIPLECRLLSRNVIAADINPYACALTRAKLHAPVSDKFPISQLIIINNLFEKNIDIDIDDVPQWVKNFFNEQTLKTTIVLMNKLLRNKQYFIVGCLLDILHHQRPGFLSYPSSHLVPYLRNKLYPRDQYPEVYGYRDPFPRLEAKIKRILKNAPPPPTTKFRVIQKSILKNYLVKSSIDSVITSPPYMDALDYSRDNRLRLWFLGATDYKSIKEKEIGKIGNFTEYMLQSLEIIIEVIKSGGTLVLIVGDFIRRTKKYDVPETICDLIDKNISNLYLECSIIDEIPNYRRARRNGRATKKETILVFRRK